MRHLRVEYDEVTAPDELHHESPIRQREDFSVDLGRLAPEGVPRLLRLHT